MPLGTPVFVAGDRSIGLISLAETSYPTPNTPGEIRMTGDLMQVILPIRNRFDLVPSKSHLRETVRVRNVELCVAVSEEDVGR